MKTYANTVTVDGHELNRWTSMGQPESVARSQMRRTFGRAKCSVVGAGGTTAPVHAHAIQGHEDRYLVTWPEYFSLGQFSEHRVMQVEIRTEEGLVGFAHLAQQLIGLPTR